MGAQLRVLPVQERSAFSRGAPDGRAGGISALPSRVDLHTHTLHSDGRLTPAELLQKAADLGVRVLSITDHDTTVGLEEALGRPLPAGLRLLAGIEMSAGGETSCHILGYGIRPEDAAFQSRLSAFRERRIGRLHEMVKKLQTLGIDIDFTRVQEIAGTATLGRPHLADALVEKKVVRSRQEAFQRFLSHTGPAYVAGDTPSSRDVIALIRAAGGVPVLAHPAYYCNEDYVRKLAEEGLMGIEVYYPDVSRALRERFLGLAAQFNLIATGGSDYHGPRTGRSELACVDVPEAVVDAIQKCQALLS